MGDWPEITEPLLDERQGMSDGEFFEFLAELLAAIGTRELEDEHYERAIGYPWERPPGSCLVTEASVEDLADIDAGRRTELVGEYLDASADRVPLLAYGANGSPERLALKGTAVRVAVLFLTPFQFTTLWWTELSYKVGALTGIRLTTDVTQNPIARVILFTSRFGAFCVDGAPVAMAALAARNRRSKELTQIEILDAAARMSIGEGATARDLIKAAFENPAAFMADHHATFQAASVPFRTEHWVQMPVG